MADEKQNENSQQTEAQIKKNKKIGKMTIQEIDQALEKTSKNQGGLKSIYAQELLRQKSFLSKK
jgi:hypothetical protein